jgi:hypothetical protein
MMSVTNEEKRKCRVLLAIQEALERKRERERERERKSKRPTNDVHGL